MMTPQATTKILCLSTLTLLLMSCGEIGDIHAGGPGNGGTGPFITTLSEELMVHSKSGPVIIIDVADTPDEQPPTTVKLVEKSASPMICDNLQRTLTLASSEIVHNTDQTTLDVTITTSVQNVSDKQQIEIKENCSSYHVTPQIFSREQCDEPQERLLLLPQQTHDYKLTLQNIPKGTYKVRYKNSVETHTEDKSEVQESEVQDSTEQCDTSVTFTIE